MGHVERFQIFLLSRTCPDASCAQGRRRFFDLPRLSKAPIAAEAVKRVDVPFAKREINGLAPQERLRVRHRRTGECICIRRRLAVAKAIEPLNSNGLLHPL